MRTGSRKIVLSLVACCIRILVQGEARAANVPPTEVAAAAAGSIAELVGLVCKQGPIPFGLTVEDCDQTAEFGHAWQVHALKDLGPQQSPSGSHLVGLLEPTSEWLFPVIFRGKARTLLTVDRVGGRIRAVAIGNAGLSRQLEEFRGRFAGSSTQGLLYSVHLPEKADFVFALEGGDVRIYPMAAGAAALGLPSGAAGKAIDPSSLQRLLRQPAKADRPH